MYTEIWEIVEYFKNRAEAFILRRISFSTYKWVKICVRAFVFN